MRRGGRVGRSGRSGARAHAVELHQARNVVGVIIPPLVEVQRAVEVAFGPVAEDLQRRAIHRQPHAWPKQQTHYWPGRRAAQQQAHPQLMIRSRKDAQLM